MDALREAARRDPLGPAVEGPSAASGHPVAWSWSDLDQAADRAALRLGEAGVGAGDAVTTILPASPEMLALLFALPRLGGLLVPLDARSLADELRRKVGRPGGVRLVLAPGGLVGELRRLLPGHGVVEVEEIVSVPDPADLPIDPFLPTAYPPPVASPLSMDHTLPIDPTLRRVVPELEADTPVVVILTSGSTGRPRPVVLTHGNLTASARGVAGRLGLDPMDRWAASLSPAHVGGLLLLHRAVSVGSPVVTRERFRAEEFLELARQGEITHASLVPVMLRSLLELSDGEPAPRGLRCLLLGGARTPLPLLTRALEGRWPVALTYGLTEASSQVATAPPVEVRAYPGRVGRPLPDVALRIDASLPGGVGEILVRGPTVAPILPWSGGARRPTVWMDAEGWLHTGDLGRLDDEGGLWVEGRTSDRILSGGVTVEPAEVEAVLLDHPGVVEAAVVGVPDETWGERVVAAVAVQVGAETDGAALVEFAGERLDPGRRPRQVQVVQALPRNRNGKVDRRLVRALFLPPEV